MNDIYIKNEDLPEWLTNKYFKHLNLISIEDIISALEDVDGEVERLTEEFEDFKHDVESNYKYMPIEEQIDYNDRW